MILIEENLTKLKEYESLDLREEVFEEVMCKKVTENLTFELKAVKVKEEWFEEYNGKEIIIIIIIKKKL